MEWLQALTPKRLVLALGACALLRLGLPYYHYPVAWYMRWRYPPQGAASPAGQDILEDNERREAAKIETRYRHILAELEQARAQGFDTAGLEAKARAARELNVKAYRHTSIRLLGEVEMAVPRAPVQYLPMGPTQAPGEDVEPDVPAKPVEDTAAAQPPKKARARRRTR